MALTLQKFPNFLPSTFTSEAKKAEIRKDLIEARLGMAREYYDAECSSVGGGREA